VTVGASTSDAASEWDLTVPVDDAELLAEFRRHGVRRGKRVHVAIVADVAEADQGSGAALPYFTPASRGHQFWRNNLGEPRNSLRHSLHADCQKKPVNESQAQSGAS
jgi:hypothetical protein